MILGPLVTARIAGEGMVQYVCTLTIYQEKRREEKEEE